MSTMKITKRSLIKMEMPYAVGLSRGDDSGKKIIAASEGYGPMYTFAAPDWEPEKILSGPGGCMSVIPGPGGADSLLAILRCFPGYNFHEAGLFEITPATGVGEWSVEMLFPLPFAHRLAQLRRGGKEYVIAASLAETKKSPEDWSLPGTVYALPVRAGRPDPDGAFPVLEGLHRNHGMLHSSFRGKEYLLISGTEGLKATPLSDSDAEWKWESWLDHEVSEMELCDLDGDGALELVTIAPFHGHRLAVHRYLDGRWVPVAESPLSFGHGLWCGEVAGRPAIIVSNRRDSKDLEMLRLETGLEPTLNKRVIDAGVGAANVEVLAEGEGVRLFATNQESGEVAMYLIEP